MLTHRGKTVGEVRIGGLLMFPRKLKPLLVASSLLVAGGCSLVPWRSDATPAPPADSVSQWHGATPPGTGGQGANDAALPLHQPRSLPINEQISLMSQRMASSEDDRKVLASRLHLVETQLEEKERALAVATKEIQETTTQVVRARNELQQWKKDTKVLRDRLGSLEKENRETLEATIKTLEQVLERDKEPVRKSEIPSVEALPLPKRG
jgi:hypothetical protein